MERDSKSKASSLKAAAMPLDIMWHRTTSVCDTVLLLYLFTASKSLFSPGIKSPDIAGGSSRSYSFVSHCLDPMVFHDHLLPDQQAPLW